MEKKCLSGVKVIKRRLNWAICIVCEKCVVQQFATAVDGIKTPFIIPNCFISRLQYQWWPKCQFNFLIRMLRIPYVPFFSVRLQHSNNLFTLSIHSLHLIIALLMKKMKYYLFFFYQKLFNEVVVAEALL